MVNRQCAQWALAVCAIVWSVVVLWGSPATALPLELKGKFEILTGEVSTHTPGKVKLIEFADFYCPHCHHFDETGVAAARERVRQQVGDHDGRVPGHSWKAPDRIRYV